MSPKRLVSLLLTLALAPPALAATGAQAPAPERADRAEIRAVLERAQLLADPLAAGAAATSIAEMRLISRLRSSEPELHVELGPAGEDAHARSATVVIRRWITGTLELHRADEHGRDVVVRKTVRDSCARQVTLRRVAEAGASPGTPHWRVASVSALVRLTPSGRASLPLVDLNTRSVSSGFLSVVSDLDELAVYPQTCAVARPGETVEVFVAGLDADAVVCVFAGDQCVAARPIDASHAVASVKLDGPAGLRQIGVTVFPRRTLVDARSPADSRTWVLPILVGTPPPPTQEYFALQ